MIDKYGLTKLELQKGLNRGGLYETTIRNNRRSYKKEISRKMDFQDD